MGAYKPGADRQVDAAIAHRQEMLGFLRQQADEDSILRRRTRSGSSSWPGGCRPTRTDGTDEELLVPTRAGTPAPAFSPSRPRRGGSPKRGRPRRSNGSSPRPARARVAEAIVQMARDTSRASDGGHAEQPDADRRGGADPCRRGGRGASRGHRRGSRAEIASFEEAGRRGGPSSGCEGAASRRHGSGTRERTEQGIMDEVASRQARGQRAAG